MLSKFDFLFIHYNYNNYIVAIIFSTNEFLRLMISKQVSKNIYYELSKKISSIYFSRLRFKLKNDCVCRLITNAYEDITSISILLYNSKDDNLANAGHYINLEKNIFSDANTEYDFMLRNINLFEYCANKYVLNKEDSCTYKDFKSSSYFFIQFYYDPNLTKVFLSEEIFNNFKKNFFETDGNNKVPIKFQQYKKYKSCLSQEDVYDLQNPDTISGKYFKTHLVNNKYSSNVFKKILNFENHFSEEKPFFETYEKCTGSRLIGNYIYLGIPLIDNQRNIGILRILWQNSGSFILTEDQLNGWLGYNGYDELKEFAEIISLHIGNSYSKDEFKQISYKSFINLSSFGEMYNKPKGAKPTNLLKDFCESIRTTINCRACIVRSGFTKITNPTIIGWSDTVTDYIHDIYLEDHFQKNSRLLEFLFSPPKDRIKDFRKIDVIGISFEIGENDFSDIKNLQFLYFTNNEILNSSSDFDFMGENVREDISNMFHEQIRRKLFNRNYKHVIIIDIPFVPNGYITLCNTQFRPFIEDDIDVIYPHINRLGSELFIMMNSDLQKRASFLSSLCHELETPVSLALAKAMEMNNEVEDLIKGKFEPAKVSALVNSIVNTKKLLPSQFIDLLRYTDSRLAVYVITNDLDRNEIETEPVLPFSLSKKIEDLLSMFTEVAVHRKVIGVIKDWDDKDCDIQITHNDKMIMAIFMYLLNNAIKYSFFPALRQEKVPGYNQDFDKKTDGHIKVKCFSNENSYGFSITNWGKRIPPEWVDRICELHERGPVDEIVESEAKRIPGQGLGLYYSKRCAELIGASLEIKPDNFKTEIQIVWKKI